MTRKNGNQVDYINVNYLSKPSALENKQENSFIYFRTVADTDSALIKTDNRTNKTLDYPETDTMFTYSESVYMGNKTLDHSHIDTDTDTDRHRAHL